MAKSLGKGAWNDGLGRVMRRYLFYLLMTYLYIEQVMGWRVILYALFASLNYYWP